MAPMVVEPSAQAGLQHLVPTQKGINLSMLIDFLLQKTYHDLTVLSELLPRKSDIERKIEIIQFATKARQQFIRLLALVKWASSADRVDKCQAISSLLDQQNAYFIDTADTLARIARETLVQARLPNFSLPTAVDVLTTGTFNRLPKCIKTKIIPDDPISTADKARALKHLNEAIQHRLVMSKVPSEFTNIQIGEGRVHLKVEHEFNVILMLMGVETDIPWRLLNIEFLMEDYITGDGKSLVHGMQIHYIHQIVQSRLMVEDDPLVDLYSTLHYFCVSLQLEILHTQCKRLIAERWGEHVKIEEYTPGQKLAISYCRSNTGKLSQKNVSLLPAISITCEDNTLLLCHVPQLKCDEDTKHDYAGITLTANCLSIEKIFSVVIKRYALSVLKDIFNTLTPIPYYKESVSLDVNDPRLNIKPYINCTCNEVVIISMDSRSGLLVLKVRNARINQKYVQQLQTILETDVNKFATEFHKLRCMLYIERCRRSVILLPVIIYDTLPISNYATHQLSTLSATKLYLRFRRHMKYCIVADINVDQSNPLKPLVEKYYLLKISEEQSSSSITEQAESRLSYIAGSLSQLDICAFYQLKMSSKKKEKKRNADLYKRKKLLDDVKVMNIRKKLKGEKDTVVPITSSTKEPEVPDTSFNTTISAVVSSSYMRIPFIELASQLATSKFTFDSVREEYNMDFVLRLVDLPKPSNCENHVTESLKKLLINCTIRMDHELNQWEINYSFSKPHITSCSFLHHQNIKFVHKNIVNGEEDKELGVSILCDWKALIKMYKYAKDIDDILSALSTSSGVEDFVLLKYDMKSLVFNYTKNRSYLVTFSYDSNNNKYVVDFTENGVSRDKCPHLLTQTQLMNELNDHGNLQYILKIIHDTYSPLQSIISIPILPTLGISNRVLSVVNNFTMIAHSSTHVKIIYRNIYILDVYFMEHSVLIRDGTFYRTDSTKAMRGFTTILQLASFLQLFVDKMQPSNLFLGHDFPVTPGGVEFDQQTEHFGPATHDSSHKDRSGAAHISSPSQFTAPSPGISYSVPSPGTFLQPSPAPANLFAMSPSTWPGSPPLVQGSPRPVKQGLNSSQPRQLLSSINVSHAPVPVVLTHAGFKVLLTPSPTKEATKLCPLEKFFGSVLLRAHLLRVLRTDDTLKLEKQEHGVIIFSGTGKNGPDSGLQYSVRLNPATMDSLILKITPMKGFENAWSPDDLKVLEQFFELKVVCSLYKVCALTAFARILGTQPKLMKDFIRIMKLELQTDWTDFLFRVEWCLTVPPGDMPTIALPGTPAVVLKTKNLIFLQLTEVKNEDNRVTITLVHDLKTNTVQLLEFPKLSPNAHPEPFTWAVRARQCLKTLLQRISEQISKKEFPIYCAVFTVLKNMHVK